jgi:hypothetical protein
MGHSMSNLRTTHMLWGQTQAWKDQYIKSYMAIAPPYMGTGLVIDWMTCGSNEYSFPLHMGFDWKTYKNTLLTLSSMFQMMPYPTYDSQKNQPWMQTIMNRIAYDNGQSSDPVFNWLPSRDDICYDAWPKANKCRSGLVEFDGWGSDMNGTKITNANLQQMLAQLSPSPNVNYFWQGRDSRYESLPNIGVNLIMVYSQVLAQEQGYDFKVDPVQWTSTKNNFCTEKEGAFTIEYVDGDTSVPSTSAMTPAIKWSIDFDNNVAGAKPVKIVEFCSSQKQSMTPYDSVNSNGEGQFTKNAYIGLPCDCTANKDRHCDHVTMLWLPKFFDFISNTLKSGTRSQLTPNFSGMSNSFFQDWQNNCRLLYDNANPSGDKSKEDVKEVLKQKLFQRAD